MSETTTDPQIAPSPLAVITNTPRQLPVPTDTSFTGDNFWRNLIQVGGALQNANDARTAGGFLAHPGGGLSSGLADAFRNISALDTAASNNQNTLAEAEQRRIGNTGLNITLEQRKQWLANPTGLGMRKTDLFGDTSTNPVPSSTPSSANETSSSELPPPSQAGTPISDERLGQMAQRVVKQNNLPASLAPVLVAIAHQESGGRYGGPDNPKSGAFSLMGLLPSTVKDPGYGVAPGDEAAFRKDPLAAMDFSGRYLYGRGTKELGMNDADFENPGRMAALVAKYGGASSPEAQQAYVGGVVNHMLRGAGRPQSEGTTPQQAMEGYYRPAQRPVNTSSAKPVTPAEQSAGLQQIQQEQAQAQAAQSPPAVPQGRPPGSYQVASNAEQAPPTDPAVAAKEQQLYDANHNLVGGTGGGFDDVMANLRGSNYGDGPVISDSAPPATPAPAPQQQAAVQPTPQATPLAPQPSGTPTTPTPPAATQPGNQPQRPADIVYPPELRRSVSNLTRQADDAYNQAVQLQLSGNPMLAPQITALFKRSEDLMQRATDLKTKFEEKRGTEGSYYPGTQNGTPGQYNTVNQKFEPNIKSAGRIVQGADHRLYFAPADGSAPYLMDQASPALLRTNEAAKKSGAQTGEQTAAMQDEIHKGYTESLATIANLDQGLKSTYEGTKQGSPPGFIAPWRLDAQRLADSLGIHIPGLNMKPDFGVSATSYQEEAEKNWVMAGGALGRAIIGPNSPYTDAKLHEFAKANPRNILTEDALVHLVSGLRQVAYYNFLKYQDGLAHIDKDGNLDPGWITQYQREHGAGPQFDPKSGELVMPGYTQDPKTGQWNLSQPSPNPPERPSASSPSAPAAPQAPRHATTGLPPKGTTQQGPNGETLTSDGNSIPIGWPTRDGMKRWNGKTFE